VGREFLLEGTEGNSFCIIKKCQEKRFRHLSHQAGQKWRTRLAQAARAETAQKRVCHESLRRNERGGREMISGYLEDQKRGQYLPTVAEVLLHSKSKSGLAVRPGTRK